MIRSFFYLQKSDRKTILALLVVVVVALIIIFLASGRCDDSNNLVFVDSIDTFSSSKHHRDSSFKQSVRERTVYVRTKVIYLDSAYQRGHRLSDAEHDSLVAHYQPKIRQGEHVILNTADTTALKTVPGIGPYFARKIVEYGERLGGYVSVDQLDEIEDFPLEAKRYLVIDHPAPRKLNVNRLSLNDLRRHPYLNFYQARTITDYRRLHGPLKSLQDLRFSKDFTPEAIERLEPYVEY